MAKPILKRKVFHVGDLRKERRARSRGSSLEGPGLSVSEHPAAWRSIAKLGRQKLYVLSRVDGKPGRFVDLTGSKKLRAHAALAVEHKLLRTAPIYRAWFPNEEGGERYSEYASRREAEEEVEGMGEGRVQKVAGYVATPELRRLWKLTFSDALDPAIALDMGVLYALEAVADCDGAWWNEELDVGALSAPRGVIFQSKVPAWRGREIDWSEAPDLE
jgi:hypothetical protein